MYEVGPDDHDQCAMTKAKELNTPSYFSAASVFYSHISLYVNVHVFIHKKISQRTHTSKVIELMFNPFYFLTVEKKLKFKKQTKYISFDFFEFFLNPLVMV